MARHVSRWKLCRPTQGSEGAETLSSASLDASPPVTQIASSSPPVSLRYLNEFVGKLHCAPALLQHGLFPDAKEVTESMALFNAVRRYIEPKGDAKESGKHDGVVVVGDGNTPRTAALFAFRMRGWKCYSVDPAMEKGTSERAKGWADVSNLVVVRNKIENVRIALRRAIVVLVHAHVTLDQALSAVQADQVCGVVTLPCCNWYGKQEELFGRGPDLVYDDFSVLSDHREIRLWVGGEGSGNVNTSHADLSLASSVMKGCVRKEMVAVNQRGIGGHMRTEENAEMQTEELKKRHDGVLDFIGDTLSELARDASTMTQEEYAAEEQTIGSSLPSAVASHLGTETHVLALGWHPRRLAVRLLLRDGYTDVYTISLAEKLSFSVDDNGTRGLKRLKLQLYKCTANLEADAGENDEDESLQLEPCGHFILQSSFVIPPTDKSEQEEGEEIITVTFENEGAPAPPISCILDVGFIFRGFRGRAKKDPAFFRHVCRTLDQLVSACGSTAPGNSRNASLVCLTPRKQWRKKEFLTHADLGYDVQSLIATRKQFRGTPVYVYCCFKQQTLSSFAAPAVTEQPIKTEDGECNTLARDAALETWLELEKKLSDRQKELGGELAVIDSPVARTKAAQDQEKAVADAQVTSSEESSSTVEPRKVYVQVTGEITRVRRFSNGMSFVSLELTGSGHDRPLQLFLQRDTLGWSPSVFAKVVSLFRKGDELVAVGYMARNARGHSMLQVEALSLARTGEFEAYN